MNHNNLPLYGFRMENSGMARRFISTPFHFRRPSDFDTDKLEIFVPEGMKAAGLWFFNDINKLSESLAWALSDSAYITRVRVSCLPNITIVEDPYFDEGVASIALQFYQPSEDPDLDLDNQFVKALTLSDDMIDIWSGEKWIRKDEISLFDLDEILKRREFGQYRLPDSEQAIRPINNEPHLPAQLSEDWRRPPESMPVNENDLFANAAQASLLRERQINHAQELEALRQEERQYRETADWHAHQAGSFKAKNDKDGEQIHKLNVLFLEADIRQLQHRRQILITRKDFWELQDIDLWADKVMQLQRIGDPNFLFRELPTEAIAPLMHRISELRYEAHFNRKQPEGTLNLLDRNDGPR